MKNLTSLQLHKIFDSNDIESLQKHIGYDLSNFHIDNTNINLYLLLLKSFLSRIYPENQFHKKHLHKFHMNDKSRRAYVKLYNFDPELCDNYRHLIKPQIGITGDTITDILTKAVRKADGKKPVRWIKDKLLIPCVYPNQVYCNLSLSKRLGFNVFQHEELEHCSVLAVPSIILEVDNHSIDTSTKIGRQQMKEWQDQVTEAFKKLSIPGTCEYTSARSYYISYVLDCGVDLDEAFDLARGLMFLIRAETGYTCDIHNTVISRKRIPLTKHQSLFFETTILPRRWQDSYYCASKLSEYIKDYILDHKKEYIQFCQDVHISSKQCYWNISLISAKSVSSSRKYKRSASYNEARNINFQKMLDKPLNLNYLEANNIPLSYVMTNNLEALRNILNISIDTSKSTSSKNIETNKVFDRYELLKTFIVNYGDKLSTLLNVSEIDSLISSPVYEDKVASCILNERFTKIKVDNNGYAVNLFKEDLSKNDFSKNECEDKYVNKTVTHEYIYHFSDYPNGDIIDYIEYALLSADNMNGTNCNDKKTATMSLSNTIDFIAALLGVQVKPYVPKEKVNFDFVTYKQQFDSFIDKSIKMMHFKPTFKKLADFIYQSLHDNYLKMSNVTDIFNAQRLLTTDYLAANLEISKATISRFVAFLTATGIVSRVTEDFASKNFEMMRNDKYQLPLILQFSDFTKIDVELNLNLVQKRNEPFSQWNASTYYDIFGTDGVIRAFGKEKARTFKPNNIQNPMMQQFADVIVKPHKKYNTTRKYNTVQQEKSQNLFIQNISKNASNNTISYNTLPNDSLTIKTSIITSSADNTILNNLTIVNEDNKFMNNSFSLKTSTKVSSENSTKNLSPSILKHQEESSFTCSLKDQLNKQLSNMISNNISNSQDNITASSLLEDLDTCNDNINGKTSMNSELTDINELEDASINTSINTVEHFSEAEVFNSLSDDKLITKDADEFVIVDNSKIKLTKSELEANKRILEEIIQNYPEERKNRFRQLRPLKILMQIPTEELTYDEMMLKLRASTSYALNANLYSSNKSLLLKQKQQNTSNIARNELQDIINFLDTTTFY